VLLRVCHPAGTLNRDRLAEGASPRRPNQGCWTGIA